MKRSVLYTHEQIIKAIEGLAKEISADYGDGLLCVCVLKGAFMFFSELVKRMDGDVRVDFVRVSSYNGNKAGTLKLLLDLNEDVAGKDILLVEDIIDSGATVSYLTKLLSGRGARSVKVACLFNKPLSQKTKVTPDYCAFSLKNDNFIVGFGLDYDEQFRCLDHVEEVRFD